MESICQSNLPPQWTQDVTIPPWPSRACRNCGIPHTGTNSCTWCCWRNMNSTFCCILSFCTCRNVFLLLAGWFSLPKLPQHVEESRFYSGSPHNDTEKYTPRYFGSICNKIWGSGCSCNYSSRLDLPSIVHFSSVCKFRSTCRFRKPNHGPRSTGTPGWGKFYNNRSRA